MPMVMRRFGQQPILKQLLGKVKRDSKCSSANHGTAAWRAAMEALPSVMAVRAMAMPHLGKPVEHARRWVADQVLGFRRLIVTSSEIDTAGPCWCHPCHGEAISPRGDTPKNRVRF
jgi:hypothetical protein